MVPGITKVSATDGVFRRDSPALHHQAGRRRILDGAPRNRAAAAQKLKPTDSATPPTGSAEPQFPSQYAGSCDDIAAAGRGDLETDQTRQDRARLPLRRGDAAGILLYRCLAGPFTAVLADMRSPRSKNIERATTAEKSIAAKRATLKLSYFLESVPRQYQGLQSFRSIRRIDASLRKASAFRERFSQSLARRRHRLSHARVRSTTQRRGKTSKPLARSDRLMISMSTRGSIFATAVLNFWP